MNLSRPHTDVRWQKPSGEMQRAILPDNKSVILAQGLASASAPGHGQVRVALSHIMSCFARLMHIHAVYPARAVVVERINATLFWEE